MKVITDGTITTPQGFVAGAVACGLKKSNNLDLALLTSKTDCTAAAVFTRNQVVAAPVIVDRQTLATNRQRIRAIVANAGCANACTGAMGLANAQATQNLAAECLGCLPDQVLVLSTGVIGVQLDMAKVSYGIQTAARELSTAAGQAAAQAIMTTDTRPKHLAMTVDLGGQVVTVGGIAKGSGMIHPDMATMLGVITTDAVVSPAILQELLGTAVDHSFNRISVDGDTSTNDTVLLLANGATGAPITDPEAIADFGRALTFVCRQLARQIVGDGEGATKLVEIIVSGAVVEANALVIAQTIATSPLVKTALTGGDPNWGRVLAAAGRAGVPLNPDKLTLWTGFGETRLRLVNQGGPDDYNEAEAVHIFAQPEFRIHLDLGLGDSEAAVWTCDLSHGYVTINADYRT